MDQILALVVGLFVIVHLSISSCKPDSVPPNTPLLRYLIIGTGTLTYTFHKCRKEDGDTRRLGTFGGESKLQRLSRTRTI